MKHGKKYRAAAAKYDLTKKYSVDSACNMVKDMKVASFDETVEAEGLESMPLIPQRLSKETKPDTATA